MCVCIYVYIYIYTYIYIYIYIHSLYPADARKPASPIPAHLLRKLAVAGSRQQCKVLALQTLPS